MRLVLATCALAALAACKDESPPRWVNRCVESYSYPVVLPVYDAMTNSTQLQTQWWTQCTREELVCLTGSDYAGALTCEDVR